MRTAHAPPLYDSLEKCLISPKLQNEVHCVNDDVQHSAITNRMLSSTLLRTHNTALIPSLTQCCLLLALGPPDVVGLHFP